MAKALRERVGQQYKGTQRTRKAVHGECTVELAKWTLPIISLCREPYEAKVSRTGLTGGLGRRAVRLRALILPTYLTPTAGSGVAFEEPSLGEWARVIKAGACIEASFQRGKGEVGMDEYQVRTWHGWHHHMALSLLAVWFLITETHRGQSLTPALTLPQVRYGLSLLLLEVFSTPGVDSICSQVQRQLLRNELARFYHHRTRKYMPPRKLRRERQ